MKKAIVVVVIGVMLLTGCASASRSMVFWPARDQTAQQAETDKAACEAWASVNKNNDNTLQNAGIGGAIGAGGGALVGAGGAIGSGSSVGHGAAGGALIGLGIGLVAGLLTGIVADRDRYTKLYGHCMRTRGYDHVAG